MHRATLVGGCLLVLTVLASAQTKYFNYETAFVRPIGVSADGSRLFVLNTPDARLEVYSLADPDRPLLLKSIQVGLEATSIAVRSNDEAWVVNSLSDSVSVVSVKAGRVTATLRVKDEPFDVVFAGTPQKAFVSVAADDEVRVFDVASKALLGVIPIFGKDPRALAVDPTGQTVYCAVHRSGNRTTILPRSQAPAPPAPTNPMLPPAPQSGLIVSLDDPQWQGMIPFTLPDNDVAEINASTMAVTRYFTGVGTILFDLAVDPQSGDIFVANIDSRNHVRFEPNLRGHAIDSRLTKISPTASAIVTPFDLNVGIDYSTLPNPAALASTLAEPTAVIVKNGVVYIAAQGSDRIGVVSPSGQVTARISLGSTNTATKRGPRGLAAHPTLDRLYVFNRLSNSISIVDTAASSVIREQDLAFDPTPVVVKNGRKFLYDARLSGNGTMSCASCHIDGDIDLLAWDLGDPDGSLLPTPIQAPPFDAMMPANFHPMKGPMLTQTLKGLDLVAPLHWRGDRTSLSEFNAVFSTLMGGQPLPPNEMTMFADYLLSVRLFPNSLQTIGRAFPGVPAGNNALDGFNFFFNTVVPFNSGASATCAGCHNAPIGMNGMVIAPAFIFEEQPLRVAPVRNSYRRVGKSASGPSKAGFGFGHDGAFATLADFLNQPEFAPWPADMKDDLETYMLCIDTGTAPTVGYDVTVTAATLANPSTESDVMTLMMQTTNGNCDAMGHGTLFGHERTILYDGNLDEWISDDPSLGPWTWTMLKQFALAGDLRMTFVGASPQSGIRQALDHDADGIMDGVDGLTHYGVPTQGTFGPLYLSANLEPKVGDGRFALTVSNTAPSAFGLLGISAGPLDFPIGALNAYVDFTLPGYFTLPLTADPDGLAAFPAPIADLPFLAGFGLYVQAAFYDPQFPGGYTASNGLHFVIQP